MSKVSEYLSKRMVDTKPRNKLGQYPVYSEKHLVCVLDALVTLGKLEAAWDIVLSCQQSRIKLFPDTINGLLWAWVESSRQGDNDKFMRAWELASENKIINQDSYSCKIYFHSKHYQYEEIQETLTQMKEGGFEPEYIVKKSRLTPHQARIVTDTLKRVAPTLTQKYPPQREGPLPSMLTELYSEERNEFSRNKIPPLNDILSFTELSNCLDEQLQTERAGYSDITSVAPPYSAAKSKVMLEMRISKFKALQETIQNWKNELIKAIKEEQTLLLSELDLPQLDTQGRTGPVLPRDTLFLCLLPPETWAEIMIHQVALPLLSLGVNGLSTFQLNNVIGEAAWHRYVINKKDKTGLFTDLSAMYNDYCRIFTNSAISSNYSSREYWQQVIQQHSNSLDIHYAIWPHRVIDSIGFHLLYLFVNTLSMPRLDIDPEIKTGKPFYYLRLKGVKEPATIYPNEKLVRFFRNASRVNKATIRIPAIALPTLIPPKPWCSIRDGGLLGLPTFLVRVTEGGHHQEIIGDNGKLRGVFDALNYLGDCPWRINKPILDNVIKIFRAGGSDELGVAKIPEKLENSPEWSPKLSPNEYFKLKSSHLQEKKANTEAYSLYMDLLYRLSVADTFRDRIFWLPHYLDFRGRAYPMSPTLSHMGDDVQRGIMKFAVGKPLGPKGLDWLKIHLINLTGLYKRTSLQERLSAANVLIDEIIESADNPMDGRGWWKDKDEPWQVLAVCKEIRDAISSGDPENFVSNIPIHQDGSCNGLQHYAALGRDPIGAQSVNLIPSIVPADVYTEVANHVEKFRSQDAKDGSLVAQKLEGLISRKVVKQPVMTEVYGVTFIGARLQVEAQLKELTNWERSELFDTSTYIVKLLNKSMAEMFQNAKGIQNWFAQSASIIARESPVEWMTPMGLICIQPYHKSFSKRITTKLQKSLSITYSSEWTKKPNVTRQRSGFPPNFIHSLDSCHMMLTSLNCQREGVTFVSIHDSYWTHASTVDAMGRILRDQFILLHSQPILEDLASHFLSVYGDKLSEKAVTFFKNIPSKGNLDISQISDSKYFFS
ncbi:DNA-directed RNA polymerase, mitochondrial [Oopsacas minuta]|uniref:DNA-directed RNA polymerase n=1 Tax=Oopsacas minuta TaxID=111878 RepID=A0AAV7JNC7_9METZ|nr:DNA-directed RNA polymerase, mitochondrial [Oopsacas minuta]